MTQKTQLISIIEEAMRELKNLEQEVPSEILHQTGTLKEWAIRDDVIHCAVYIQRFADRLGWPRDHARDDLGDYLKFNDEVWKMHQSET